jgi:DNA repair exonuclease SbcCD nuclease subunit
MIFSFISDVHAALYKEFARGEDRLNDIIRVLDAWAKDSKDNGAEVGVICGDLFHVKGIISVAVFNSVFKTIWQAMTDGCFQRLYLLVGNHDQAVKDGSVHSLEAFGAIPGVTVIGEPTEASEGGKSLLFIPYSEDAEKIKEMVTAHRGMNHLIFMHHGISGAKVGPTDYVMKDEIATTFFRGYELVVSGHYHKSQWMAENVLIPGSPIQLNRGERNDGDKGWWIYDSSKPVEHDENPVMDFLDDTPKFMEISSDEIDDVKSSLRHNFITVTLSEGEDYQEVAERLKQAGARAVTRRIDSGRADEIKRAAGEINLDMGEVDVVQRYCKLHEKEEDVQIGLDYLRGVGLTDNK